jgi:hypothetical protein
MTGLNHWRMDIRRRFVSVANSPPAYFDGGLELKTHFDL